MPITYSPDQVKAIHGICNLILDPNNQKHSLAVLTGPAGTGKTTVVTAILEEIYRNYPLTEVNLCATTHRAAKVLSQSVGESVTTAHTVFALKPGISKHGKEELKSSGVPKISDGSVVIIDEASMLSDTFLKAMVPLTAERSLKIIFVGDPFQLPPPKDTCSLFDGSLPTFTLSQIHRQAHDNPILDKASEYREFIEGIRPTMPTLVTDMNSLGAGIEVLPHSDFVTAFVNKYVNYPAGADVTVPMCTYTNESAIGYNNMIRKAAYFLEDTILPFYKGEQLIANSIVMKGRHAVLVNNESVQVNSYMAHKLQGIPGYLVNVKGDFSTFHKSDNKSVFVPQNKLAADTVLKQLVARAKKGVGGGWAEYYQLKNEIADLRPPFAGTTHKAQGGTYPAVFIDQININKCHDEVTKARLMYVALTRANTNVYVNS